MSVILHKADCFDVLPTLRDRSVNLVLTDLPYGTTRNKWDLVIHLARLWSEYRRVAKSNAAIVLMSAQPFTTQLIMSNRGEYRYNYVWVKNRKTGQLNAKRRPMVGHEDICVFYREQPTFNVQLRPAEYKLRKGSAKTDTPNYGAASAIGYRKPDNGEFVTADTVLRFDCEIGLHPTQKPIGLMEHMVRTYSSPGDTVLDNCMGSGTTGVAALSLARHFIGIEREQQYFDIAERRLAAVADTRRTDVAESTPRDRFSEQAPS